MITNILDKLRVVSVPLRRALIRDLIMYGTCAVEIVFLDLGVRIRKRADVTRLVFDHQIMRYYYV